MPFNNQNIHAMKFLLYSCMLFVLCACKKDKAYVNSTLIGKWKLTATAMSIGGPIEETPADLAKPSYIEFKSDGTVKYTPDSVNRSGHFTIDGDKVTFTSSGNTSQYTIENGELKIWPVFPTRCIEGCYSKYRSVR